MAFQSSDIIFIVHPTEMKCKFLFLFFERNISHHFFLFNYSALREEIEWVIFTNQKSSYNVFIRFYPKFKNNPILLNSSKSVVYFANPRT